MSEINTGAVDWRKVDLNLLTMFYRLYQTRSVSLAAEKSFVSQSAMSHSLAKLRVICSDPLFERKGHQMQPTQKANELFPVVEQILNLVETNLLSGGEFHPEVYQGAIRIGLTDYAEFIFAPSIYDAIVSQAPCAKISFVNVNRHNYQAVDDRQSLDVIIGSIAPLPDNYQSQTLYTEKHVCIYDPRFVRFEHLGIEQFIDTPHCLVSPDGQFRSKVDEYLDSIGQKRNVAAVSGHFLTIGQLVQGRKLLAIVPEKMAQISAMQSNVKTVSTPVPVPDFDISMIWKKQRHDLDRVQWLRQLLYEAIITQVSANP
ncbi:LysR family transcriptional regulator [Vibrio hippocampi]|uniref:PCP degradation transcriptional activation protein n=1 Tax=Vibrio hippocampi TaxID=654686 RepID=A0ABN8DHF3_9VIBR|nr:LysR family transcriptional regulator [Vibrio hippocampi]CAH0525031.1 PCP degradation transcriptional activation protein [Vibrio hippocampi]